MIVTLQNLSRQQLELIANVAYLYDDLRNAAIKIQKESGIWLCQMTISGCCSSWKVGLTSSYNFGFDEYNLIVSSHFLSKFAGQLYTAKKNSSFLELISTVGTKDDLDSIYDKL